MSKTLASDRWIATNKLLPLKDTKIDWLCSDGSIVYNGSYSGKLWFLPDGIYVYYTPQFWRLSTNAS